MKALVSIIVPVYNVERYLDRCIESLVNQTYQNLEIILVDDGSPDGCPQKCDEWAMRDARIKVIHKANAGVGMARNSGLKFSMGDCLMFVDPDDYISCNAVEVLLDRLLSDGSDMVFGKHVDVYENGDINNSSCIWMKDSVLSKEEVFEQEGKEYHYAVAVWAKLYKKEIFEDLAFPIMICGEDLWLYPITVEKCKKISITEREIYFYFQRENSAMHKKSLRSQMDEINATLYFSQFLYQRNFIDGARKRYIRAIRQALASDDKKTAVKLFKKNFTPSERLFLLKDAGVKNYLRWLCMQVPFIYSAIQLLKRSVKGR